MATEQLPPTERQTIADLVRRIINGVQDIIDRQIELAKQELKETVTQVAKASGLLIAGGVLLFLTAIFLLITIIMNFFVFPYVQLLPVVARDELQVGPIELGWLAAANGARRG